MTAAAAAGTVGAALLLTLAPAYAAAQELILRCDPSQTMARWTLDATLHTVSGDFKLKRGEIQFHPTSGETSGKIVFDATSGQSGNSSRDSKMHRVVLESRQYPEISFRPDHTAGQINPGEVSTVEVHGTFAIHGSDHEIAVPVEVRLEADHWSAAAQFSVPYVAWGMKNPSTFFLRVADSVEVEMRAAGEVSRSP